MEGPEDVHRRPTLKTKGMLPCRNLMMPRNEPATTQRSQGHRLLSSMASRAPWVNNTGVIQYQFVASLVDTCGVCLQYHLAIGRRWGIPYHFGCNCHQVVIRRGEKSPHAFIDYRALLDGMTHEQQAKALGDGNYCLLKERLATWEDIVTRTRACGR